MESLNIAIVGLPNSGKTTLLTKLCIQRKHIPLNKETFDFENKKGTLLQNGNWEEWVATDPNKTPAELGWEVEYKNCKYILKAKDFAGEIWKKFIIKYGNYDEPSVVGKESLDDDDLKDITQFILNASRIIVCVDLQRFIDNIDNEAKDQLWLPCAIINFAQKNKISLKNICIVFTKYDAIKQYINNNYKITGNAADEVNDRGEAKALDNFLKKQRFNMLKDITYMPVSIADFKFDPQQEIYIPKKDSSPKNLGKLTKFIFSNWKISTARGLQTVEKKVIRETVKIYKDVENEGKKRLDEILQVTDETINQSKEKIKKICTQRKDECNTRSKKNIDTPKIRTKLRRIK